MPRFHVALPLSTDAELALPPGAARHVQVLRLQPGGAITLFDGTGGEWDATITRMGRSDVQVRVGAHHAVERESTRAVHLVVGLMAAERMDWLVEKATELGAASLTPVLMARSSLRLSGERAEKKRAHWQAVSNAACEQSGRNRLLDVREQLTFQEYSRNATNATNATPARWVLSLAPDARPLAGCAAALSPTDDVTMVSGPEGGLRRRLAADHARRARAAGRNGAVGGAGAAHALTARRCCATGG